MSYRDWHRREKAAAPTAEVIRVHGGYVTIRCPFCDAEHEHSKTQAGATEHRAAACPLYYPINREDRTRGYTFSI